MRPSAICCVCQVLRFSPRFGSDVDAGSDVSERTALVVYTIRCECPLGCGLLLLRFYRCQRASAGDWRAERQSSFHSAETLSPPPLRCGDASASETTAGSNWNGGIMSKWNRNSNHHLPFSWPRPLSSWPWLIWIFGSLLLVFLVRIPLWFVQINATAEQWWQVGDGGSWLAKWMGVGWCACAGRVFAGLWFGNTCSAFGGGLSGFSAIFYLLFLFFVDQLKPPSIW